MLVAQGQHQTRLVVAIVAILSVLTVALFNAVEFVERRTIPWYGANARVPAPREDGHAGRAQR